MRGRIGQLAALALLALALLAAGRVAGAAASVTIESPPDETTTNDATPTFAGSAESLGGAVTLSIHEGGSAAGSIAQELTALPFAGTWSVTATTPLADGTYTAVAEQSELLGEPFPPSLPVTFTVDTTPPSVSLNAVASPTKDPTPTLEGSAGTAAGDDEEVTVEIFSGQNVVASATVGGGGGSWSFTPSHLSDGTYTEVLNDSEIQPDTEVVTSIITPEMAAKPAGTNNNANNPLMPQRGRGGPGGPGGGGAGRGGGR